MSPSQAVMSRPSAFMLRRRGRRAQQAAETPVGLSDCTFSTYVHGSGAPPCVVTNAEPPFQILWANSPWLDLCGFNAVEILGNTLACIQGPATDAHLIHELMSHAYAKDSCTVNGLINYTKRQKPFCHSIDVEYVPSPSAGTKPDVFCVMSSSVIARTIELTWRGTDENS